MYYVYILRSQKDGKRYIGMSDNISRRIEEHNKGKVTSTRRRRPFLFEYYETYKTRIEARKREIYFKTAAGRKWLDQNVKTLKVAD